MRLGPERSQTRQCGTLVFGLRRGGLQGEADLKDGVRRGGEVVKEQLGGLNDG